MSKITQNHESMATLHAPNDRTDGGGGCGGGGARLLKNIKYPIYLLGEGSFRKVPNRNE